MKKKYEKFQNVAYSVDKKNLFLVTVQITADTAEIAEVIREQAKKLCGFSH